MGTMGADFEWTPENTVVESVDAIAVYESESGHAVIRQEGRNGEDDTLVVLPFSNLERLIAGLKELLAEHK